MIELAILAACLEHGTDHDLIRAIATQESLGEPTAFYINQWSLDQFRGLSLRDAIMVTENFVAEGFTVDVGLMGINSRNITKFGTSITEAFNPCTNIQLGEKILVDNISYAQNHGHFGDQAIKVALSLYNTGSMTRGFDNGYVDKVWEHYSAILTHTANDSDIDVSWPVASELAPVERMKPTWIDTQGNSHE